MKYITKEVRIGIAGIVALCVLIYGINWLKGIHMFQPSSYFYAKFENVNGLTKSSPVFADGVRVGIVRDIYYDYAKPGNVIVEVELDTELRIPKGSSAELVSELMGGVRMNILLPWGSVLPRFPSFRCSVCRGSYLLRKERFSMIVISVGCGFWFSSSGCFVSLIKSMALIKLASFSFI